VQTRLDWKWSPEQISNQLKLDFPAEEVMRVSPETIYRSIFVQARGTLRRDIEVKLRTGRTIRKPRKQTALNGSSRGRMPGMVMLSERPAEVADRAVPGHWEGDLIVGSRNASQIGTLVERSTRYCMLVHLPGTKEAPVVADALIATIKTLPAELMKSLTWDQGLEMASHQRVTIATDVAIYFCDPHSPWQRGSNENTNGLLRQYFPKGTDLSQHTAEHLAFVARELNGRPRKTLGWKTPAQAFEELLLATQREPGVATTA
jgi:transposase, IS30 family